MGWGWCMQRAGEGSTGDRGGGARAERTTNMANMPEKPWVETMLDVSKLSGWLNATAFCPVERGALKARRVGTELECAGAGGARNGRARGQGATRGCGAWAERGMGGTGHGRNAHKTCPAWW